MRLGETIRTRRIELDLSLREVAKRVKCSPPHLSDIELDRRIPSERLMRSIGNALGLEFSWLEALAGQFSVEAHNALRERPEFGAAVNRLAKRFCARPGQSAQSRFNELFPKPRRKRNA
jgi:transcriptional regulator with XRE-family HTH domain